MRSIAFATYRGLPELSVGDQLAAAQLLARGVTVQPISWDADADWSSFEAVIVRSCWDYTTRLGEFLAWADRVAAQTPLWNPPSLLRWNAHKTYLRDLGERGVDIVPTEWLPPGGAASFAEVLEARGWGEVVLKPIVSASANDTWRADRARPHEGQALLNRLLRGSGALVQPFLPEIMSGGEWSFVVFSSSYSHAVCKRPAPGDFRVQLEFGGTVRRRHAPEALVAQAPARDQRPRRTLALRARRRRRGRRAPPRDGGRMHRARALPRRRPGHGRLFRRRRRGPVVLPR
jgi:hypothetical protein